MSYRTILVHVGDDRAGTDRVVLAQAVARAHDAHLIGLMVLPPPMLPPAYGEAVSYVGTELIQAQRDAAAEQAARVRAGFEDSCRRAEVLFEWRQQEGDAMRILPEQARYADLAVVGQGSAEGLDAVAMQLPERTVLASGGPTLVVPNAGRFEQIGRHVLVAWNGGREAARAVGDALPLLRRAEQVTILEIDPADETGQSAVDLATRLARHGVEVSAEHTVSAGIGVGDVILSHLAERGCDCLVMGAYGHSRLREIALGGATRSVLETMTVPVLFGA